MSQKLPVGDVLNEAVQFGLHRWSTVLRFALGPMLVSMLLVGVVAAVLLDPFFFTESGKDATLESMKGGLRFPMSITALIGGLAYLFVIFLFCGVMASMYRLVALGEERRGFFQLRMDGPAKRVFFAYLILMLLNFAIWGVAFYFALGMTGDSWDSVVKGFGEFMALISVAEQASESEIEAALIALMPTLKPFGLAILYAAIPLIYVNTKLAPFPAGSAAENRLLLFGSFGMTFGHFWSILGVSILGFIFLMLLSMIFQLALMVFQMIAALLITQGAGMAIFAAIIGVGIAVLSIFFKLFTFAFQTSIHAIIYRRLKTGE